LLQVVTRVLKNEAVFSLDSSICEDTFHYQFIKHDISLVFNSQLVIKVR